MKPYKDYQIGTLLDHPGDVCYDKHLGCGIGQIKAGLATEDRDLICGSCRAKMCSETFLSKTSKPTCLKVSVRLACGICHTRLTDEYVREIVFLKQIVISSPFFFCDYDESQGAHCNCPRLLHDGCHSTTILRRDWHTRATRTRGWSDSSRTVRSVLALVLLYFGPAFSSLKRKCGDLQVISHSAVHLTYSQYKGSTRSGLLFDMSNGLSVQSCGCRVLKSHVVCLARCCVSGVECRA